MSVNDSVTQILQRVKNDAFDKKTNARTLTAVGGAQRLAAILGEIDETMLARKLTFKVGQDAHLAMDVGSRRMARVIDVNPKSLIKDDKLVFEMRNETTLDDQVKAQAELLTGFAQIEGRLTVVSQAGEGDFAAGDVGFRVRELRDATAGHEFKEDPSEALLSSKSEAKKPADDKDAAKTPTPVDKPTPAEKRERRKKTKAPVQTGAKPKAAEKPVVIAKTSEQSQKELADFFAACEAFCSNVLLISKKGKIEKFAGTGSSQPDWEERAKDIAKDAGIWLSGGVASWMTSMENDVLPQSQLVIFRTKKLQDESVGIVLSGTSMVTAIFKNADLTRVISAANKSQNWKVAT